MITVLNLIHILAAAAVGLSAGPGGEGSSAPASAGVWVERQTYAMGTVLNVAVEAGSREAGMTAVEAAFAEVRRLEGMLSSWSGDTEVRRINAAPVGEAVPITAELSRLLEEAQEWTRRTGGAFDPAVGALIDAWDLRGEGRRPTTSELAAAVEATGMDRFDLDPEGRVIVRRSAAGWLDTGGFGKGAALAAAIEVLRAHGAIAGKLDFGGQLAVFGPAADGGAWPIGVAHPEVRDSAVAAIRLQAGSVATSGQSERHVEAGGERVGHILDPRTGLPVRAWGSVTVVAPDPFVADVLSTALFVLGPEEGLRLASGLGGVGVLFVEARAGQVEQRSNAVFERYRVDQPYRARARR